MQLLILMNTLIYENAISGADILAIELGKRLKDKYGIKVMTTRLGQEVWRDTEPSAELRIIPSFDRFISPLLVALILMLRAFSACLQVRWIDQPLISYSSSDYICDILPAAYLKKKNEKNLWISRVHHVILSPWERKGNFLINVLSFLGQRLSFWIIKRRSDLILTLSGTYDELIRLGFPTDKIAVSNPGVNLKTIDSVQALEKMYDAVFLGRLHPTKGVYDMLEIWKYVTMNERDAKLAIIGGGSKEIVHCLRKLIAEYGLQTNVDLLGFIPNDKQVYKILKSSKVYVDPEHEDGWSMSGSEAMACGLPMVAYNLKLFETAFHQGFITVPLYHKKEFADVVVDLLRDEKKRLELAEEAYQEASKFAWEEVAARLCSLIDTLIPSK